jgi:hypothetical protein
MPHTVGSEKHAGPDLADCWRLFVDRHRNALRDQRIGPEQAPDPASDDGDMGAGLHHYRLLVLDG